MQKLNPRNSDILPIQSPFRQTNLLPPLPIVSITIATLQTPSPHTMLALEHPRDNPGRLHDANADIANTRPTIRDLVFDVTNSARD